MRRVIAGVSVWLVAAALQLGLIAVMSDKVRQAVLAFIAGIVAAHVAGWAEKR